MSRVDELEDALGQYLAKCKNDPDQLSQTDHNRYHRLADEYWELRRLDLQHQPPPI